MADRTKITLYFPDYSVIGYPEDIARIQNIFDERGFFVDDVSVEKAWAKHSDSFAASWLMLPDSDDEIFDIVNSYLTTQADI